MDFPAGQTVRSGWDPVSAAARVCLKCVHMYTSVQCAQHHLASL